MSKELAKNECWNQIPLFNGIQDYHSRPASLTFGVSRFLPLRLFSSLASRRSGSCASICFMAGVTVLRSISWTSPCHRQAPRSPGAVTEGAPARGSPCPVACAAATAGASSARMAGTR